jgi:Fe-S oxidoreductase
LGAKPGKMRIDNVSVDRSSFDQPVYLHGHCYQKSQPPAADGFPVGTQATRRLLQEVGYQVELMDTGCCGMAGAFGYESEHYDLSIEVGEISLFPQLRQVGEGSIIAACGYSCLSQIEDETGKIAGHFISLVHDKVFAEPI